MPTLRILILGGTTQASLLAAALAERSDIDAVLSYAGRTKSLKSQPIPTRVGGFGGVDGLAAYLRLHAIDLLIDATHPHAARISANAAAAASATDTAIFAYTRPIWHKLPGDRWVEVADNAAALAAIGAEPKRVFLTIGRLGVGDFRIGPPHHYLIRTIDPPPVDDLPADHTLLLALGEFTTDAEIALLKAERIDVVVTKNSGGEATYGKIAAARALHVPVIMVMPPARPAIREVYSLDACLEAIAAHGSTLSIGTERRV